LIPMMPYGAYQHMSDEDVQSIVAYLRTVPPYKQTKARTENQLDFMPRMLFMKIGVQMHPPAQNVPGPPLMPAPTGKPDQDEKIQRENLVARGKYVATIAACGECHSMTKKGPRKMDDPQYLSGSEGPYEDPAVGKVWARNLTPDKETGIGKYFPEQIK